MIWIVLSILSSASMMLIFKFFQKFKVDTFYAIVVNYLVCVFVGLFFIPSFSLSAQASWGFMPLALLLGAMFITLFFLIGITTQKMGVSVATVAMKLGYVLPIILAFTIYSETISGFKIAGIILTMFAVILTSIKKSDNELTKGINNFLFPLIIFIGSGVADSIVQYTEKTFFKQGGFEIFNLVLFGTAFLIGLIMAVYRDLKNGYTLFNKKNLLAGIILGVPNYFSIYFMFKALNHPTFESSIVFPVNNIGIVVSSTVLAFIIFKEKLSFLNHLGLLLAVLSIVLMTPKITDFLMSLF